MIILSKLKKILHYLENSLIMSPVDNVISSQTLYESLLACLDLYEVNSDECWKVECKELASKICQTQQPDGGWDIGYNFKFGQNIKKSKKFESTTPEVVSIYSLYRYGEVFGFDEIQKNIDKGIEWIKNGIFITEEGNYAIPYAPGTIETVHITNGVSFTLGVIGYYLKFNRDDRNMIDIFNSMIAFTYNQLENYKYGKYWPYFHQTSYTAPKGLAGEKIDNYHIGQQLKYHCSAYKNFPTEQNLEIIKLVNKYLKAKMKEHGILAYIEYRDDLSKHVDMWGYASVAKGLLESGIILNDDESINAAKEIINWIIKHSWNREYFIPILSRNGNIVDANYYPRSDAWVLHSIAHYLKVIGFNNDFYEICKKSYFKIKECGFRGLENHALNSRIEIYSSLKSKVKSRILERK